MSTAGVRASATEGSPAAPRHADNDASHGLLADLLKRDGRSCNQIAKAVGIDTSYLTRLRLEKRPGPSRAVIAALANGLGIRPAERWALLAAAGYLPVPWGPAFTEIARVLTDERLSPEDRAEFEDEIARICRWQLRILTARELGR